MTLESFTKDIHNFDYTNKEAFEFALKKHNIVENKILARFACWSDWIEKNIDKTIADVPDHLHPRHNAYTPQKDVIKIDLFNGKFFDVVYQTHKHNADILCFSDRLKNIYLFSNENDNREVNKYKFCVFLSCTNFSSKQNDFNIVQSVFENSTNDRIVKYLCLTKYSNFLSKENYFSVPNLNSKDIENFFRMFITYKILPSNMISNERIYSFCDGFDFDSVNDASSYSGVIATIPKVKTIHRELATNQFKIFVERYFPHHSTIQSNCIFLSNLLFEYCQENIFDVDYIFHLYRIACENKRQYLIDLLIRLGIDKENLIFI